MGILQKVNGEVIFCSDTFTKFDHVTHVIHAFCLNDKEGVLSNPLQT